MQAGGSDSDQPWDVSVDHAAQLMTHCLTTRVALGTEGFLSDYGPTDQHNIRRRNSLPETGLDISSLPGHCHQKNVPKQTPLAASGGL